MQASSCKPDPRPDEKVYFGPFMLDSVRDYIAFTPGSWWIYENNRTNERDTVTVLNSQIFMKTFQESKVKDGKYYIVEIEDYKSRLYSTQSKRAHNYERGYPCINCVAFPQNDTGIISIIKGQSLAVRFFFKPKQVKYDEFYPSVTINGKTYKNVYGFHCELDNTLPPWDTKKFEINSIYYSTYYFAQNVGLVSLKYRGSVGTHYDSAYWNLIDYNVTKY